MSTDSFLIPTLTAHLRDIGKYGPNILFFAPSVTIDATQRTTTIDLKTINLNTIYWQARREERRFPCYEDFLAKNSLYATFYAMYVLKKRFGAAEQQILTNPITALLYSYYVLGRPWAEAEKIILSNNDTSFYYRVLFGYTYDFDQKSQDQKNQVVLKLHSFQHHAASFL